MHTTMTCPTECAMEQRIDVNISELFILSRRINTTDDKTIPPKEIQNVLEKGLEITPPPFGEHCFKPYECPFWGRCKSHLPKDSIFDIKGGMRTSTKVKLYYEGVKDMNAFLSLKKQNPKYRQQARLQVEKNDETEVDMDALKCFLDTLEFPLTSLDFETIAPSIPVFDGTRPYDQIVTQFSAHILKDWSGSLSTSNSLRIRTRIGELN